MVIIRDIVEPQEGLVYKSDEIKLKIGNVQIGTGTLYISEDNLSWKPANKIEGISILWKQISLHGISNTPVKSVYFIVEQNIVWNGVYGAANGANGDGNGIIDQIGNNQDDSDNDEGHESDCDEMTELWLIPVDSTSVDPIFQAMKECQTLHPDSADSVSDESDFMDAVEEQDEDHRDDDQVGDMRNLNIDDRFADANEDQ